MSSAVLLCCSEHGMRTFQRQAASSSAHSYPGPSIRQPHARPKPKNNDEGCHSRWSRGCDSPLVDWTLQAVGPFDIVPGEALAEDTRFELVRGCSQQAFQLLTSSERL